MNYLVLETHPAYVVVLDEQGRFLKAANQNYQVGQQLGQIIPFRQPKPEISWVKKSMASLAGLQPASVWCWADTLATTSPTSPPTAPYW